MNSHELTELALRIQRLEDEVRAVRAVSPTGPVTTNLAEAARKLSYASTGLEPLIGSAAINEAGL